MRIPSSTATPWPKMNHNITYRMLERVSEKKGTGQNVAICWLKVLHYFYIIYMKYSRKFIRVISFDYMKHVIISAYTSYIVLNVAEHNRKHLFAL